jgi:NTE family protein
MVKTKTSNKPKLQRNIHLPDDYFDEKTPKEEEFFLEKKTIETRKNSRVASYFKDFFKKKKKIALVLSGGAARGLAHIGVIKVLEKNGIFPDLIVGTSMGSLVGAVYAMDQDISLFDKYLNYELKDLVQLNDFSIGAGGLIKGQKVIYILSKILGRPRTFDELKIPLIINAVDIKTGKEFVFEKGNVIDAVRSSISIPMIFSPVKLGNRLLVDGGVVNPAATSLVPDNYHTVILSDVNCYANKLSNKPNIRNIFEQFMILYHQNLMKIKCPEKTILIEPNLSGLSLSSFGKMKEFIHRGEKAAEKEIKKIKKRLGM